MGRDTLSKKGGKRSKKAPKKPKQPDAMPKRNQSSYFLFSNERREQIKAENPSKKLTELSRLIADEWKKKSDDEKKVYADKSAVLKQAYLLRMEEYKKTDEYAAYTAACDQWKIDKKQWEKADDADSDGEPLKVSMPRKPKDEKCPKRPLTSYFLYAKDVRAATKEEFPNKPITEIAKEISKKWKLLTEEEKKPFNDESIALKEQLRKIWKSIMAAKHSWHLKQNWMRGRMNVINERVLQRRKRIRSEREKRQKWQKRSRQKRVQKERKRKKMQRMQESSDESSSDSDSSDSESGSSSSGSSSGSDSDSSSGSDSSSD